MNRQDAGITLIELVVSMAIFAVIAVMGVQALNGTLRAQTRLEGAAVQTTKLANGLALLRNDLANAVPIPFDDADGSAQSSLETGVGGQSFSISIGGQRNLTSLALPAFHRVTWSVDPTTGVLSRTVWPTLSPVNGAQRVSPVPVLDGVAQLDMRIFLARQGWQDAVQLQSGGINSELPVAIELTMIVDGIGPVRLVETLK
ncbi:type II secretion system protein GspJ [uncultured Litoreibacter sp.]|uniref:GspJ family type II secretion system protein n=1 Tax=uncultured Litoreibacter sp. TaxID=1392394 RepID=UPI00261B3B0C|nr:type II secretion system protein GspJ [uncultured Litoreibacter sp.]